MASPSFFLPPPLQYELTTLLVSDRRGQGVPVLWALTSSSTTEVVYSILKGFVEKLRAAEPNWQPSCIFIDDSEVYIGAWNRIIQE